MPSTDHPLSIYMGKTAAEIIGNQGWKGRAIQHADWRIGWTEVADTVRARPNFSQRIIAPSNPTPAVTGFIHRYVATRVFEPTTTRRCNSTAADSVSSTAIQ